MRRTVTAAATLALLLTASCGSEDAPPVPAAVPAEPAAIPAGALPGATSDAVTLDVQTVATDAAELEELEALLMEAGFTGGSQRLFSKVAGGRRRMLARVLEFETAAGAQRYVEWLSDHVDEVIGDAELDPGLEVPAAGTAFVHEPDPCCHNDTRIFLVVWTRGERVITLEIGGQAARASSVGELASLLDTAI